MDVLFSQLGRPYSLGGITGGLRSRKGKLKNLGITAPSRSTLAYPIWTRTVENEFCLIWTPVEIFWQIRKKIDIRGNVLKPNFGKDRFGILPTSEGYKSTRAIVLKLLTSLAEFICRLLPNAISNAIIASETLIVFMSRDQE